MPFFALAINQIAVSHLSKPSGLSSKIVPTFSLADIRASIAPSNRYREVASKTVRHFTAASTTAHSKLDILESVTSISLPSGDIEKTADRDLFLTVIPSPIFTAPAFASPLCPHAVAPTS